MSFNLFRFSRPSIFSILLNDRSLNKLQLEFQKNKIELLFIFTTNQAKPNLPNFRDLLFSRLHYYLIGVLQC